MFVKKKNGKFLIINAQTFFSYIIKIKLLLRGYYRSGGISYLLILIKIDAFFF